MLDTLIKNKRAEEENPTTKNIVYWVLIAVFIVIVWFIIKAIIKKMFTLY